MFYYSGRKLGFVAKLQRRTQHGLARGRLLIDNMRLHEDCILGVLGTNYRGNRMVV